MGSIGERLLLSAELSSLTPTPPPRLFREPWSCFHTSPPVSTRICWFVWKWGTPSPSSFPIKSQVFIVNPRFFGQAIRKELISFMADGVSKVGVYNPVWGALCGDSCENLGVLRFFNSQPSLVGGIPTPLKNMSQLGLLFPICGYIFQCSKPPTRSWPLHDSLMKATKLGYMVHLPNGPMGQWAMGMIPKWQF